METLEKKPRRQPGRPRTGQTVQKRTVMLPNDLFEWAMAQPESLSALVRQLLQAERQRREGLTLPSA